MTKIFQLALIAACGLATTSIHAANGRRPVTGVVGVFGSQNPSVANRSRYAGGGSGFAVSAPRLQRAPMNSMGMGNGMGMSVPGMNGMGMSSMGMQGMTGMGGMGFGMNQQHRSARQNGVKPQFTRSNRRSMGSMYQSSSASGMRGRNFRR